MSIYLDQPLGGTYVGDTIVNVDAGADVIVRFGGNVNRDVVIGQGSTDGDITFIALRNGTGVQHYVYIPTDTLTNTTGRP